jgi:hypothetical protein
MKKANSYLCIKAKKCIFYQLANKTRNLLFAIHLLILIITIYGDRTIIAIIIWDARRRIRN